jgi:hypothetical protein
VENHLQQQIAQLLPQVLHVAALDRIDGLVGFLDQVGNQAAMGLLGIPRATAGSAQAVHDGAQAFHLAALVGAIDHLGVGHRSSWAWAAW